MRLVEAIVELKSGNCEAIYRGCDKTWRIVLNEVGILEYAVICSNLMLNVDDFEADDWQLIVRARRCKELEISKWAIILDATNEIILLLDKEKEPWTLSTGTSCIKLTGTIKREVKPKVKHREKVGFATPTCYIVDSIPKNINCDLFAEWED